MYGTCSLMLGGQTQDVPDRPCLSLRRPPEVHDNPLCFGGVQDLVVVCTLLGHMLDHLSVTGLIVVVNKSHHRGVISKL